MDYNIKENVFGQAGEKWDKEEISGGIWMVWQRKMQKSGWNRNIWSTVVSPKRSRKKKMKKLRFGKSFQNKSELAPGRKCDGTLHGLHINIDQKHNTNDQLLVFDKFTINY